MPSSCLRSIRVELALQSKSYAADGMPPICMVHKLPSPISLSQDDSYYVHYFAPSTEEKCRLDCEPINLSVIMRSH